MKTSPLRISVWHQRQCPFAHLVHWVIETLGRSSAGFVERCDPVEVSVEREGHHVHPQHRSRVVSRQQRERFGMLCGIACAHAARDNPDAREVFEVSLLLSSEEEKLGTHEPSKVVVEVVEIVVPRAISRRALRSIPSSAWCHNS